jgi:hypothetical protein
MGMTVHESTGAAGGNRFIWLNPVIGKMAGERTMIHHFRFAIITMVLCCLLVAGVVPSVAAEKVKEINITYVKAPLNVPSNGMLEKTIAIEGLIAKVE